MRYAIVIFSAIFLLSCASTMSTDPPDQEVPKSFVEEYPAGIPAERFVLTRVTLESGIEYSEECDPQFSKVFEDVYNDNPFEIGEDQIPMFDSCLREEFRKLRKIAQLRKVIEQKRQERRTTPPVNRPSVDSHQTMVAK